MGRIAIWYRARRRWQQVLLAMMAGAFAGLGQAPFDAPVALLIGLFAGFSMFIQSPNVRRAALTGWAFGSGYFALSMMWIVEPFLVDAATYGWMAPFALVFLAGGLALFWALGFGVARALGPAVWGLPPALAAAELLRAYVLTGFPWGMPAQAMVNGMLGQAAAWIGPHGVNLLIFTLIAILVVPKARATRAHSVQAVVGVALVSLVYWSVVAMPIEAGVPENGGRIIRMIQPNAPQHQKWDRAMMPVFFRRQLEFTGAAPRDGGPRPDLVIWSETALPTMLHYAQDVLEEVAKRAGGAPVVAGVQRLDDQKLFNTMVVIDPTGKVTAQYDKHHLVPFGEYIPMGDYLEQFGLRGLAASQGYGFSAGPGPQLVEIAGFGRALPLICYEAVFPQDVNNAPERPDFLLQITNDAWFGNFSGPYQHLAIARMRAIEQGLPMVRVANTGVSAMIDARGVVTHSIALGTAGFLDAPLGAALPVTVYARIGDLGVLVLLVLVLSGLRLNRRYTKIANRD